MKEVSKKVFYELVMKTLKEGYFKNKSDSELKKMESNEEYISYVEDGYSNYESGIFSANGAARAAADNIFLWF